MQSVEGESSVGGSATWLSELRKRLVTHRAVSSPVYLSENSMQQFRDQTLTYKTFKSRIINVRYGPLSLIPWIHWLESLEMHRRNKQNQLENQATDFQRKAGAAKERNDPRH